MNRSIMLSTSWVSFLVIAFLMQNCNSQGFPAKAIRNGLKSVLRSRTKYVIDDMGSGSEWPGLSLIPRRQKTWQNFLLKLF